MSRRPTRTTPPRLGGLLLALPLLIGVALLLPTTPTTPAPAPSASPNASTPVGMDPFDAFILLEPYVPSTPVDPASCTGDDSRLCIAQAYADLAYTEGAVESLRRLEGAIADPSIGGACHLISHRIGAAALIAAGDNVAAAVAAGADDGGRGGALCGSGYYHGILVGAEPESGGVEAFAVRLHEICSAPDAWTVIDVGVNCVHAAGHALTSSSGYDLPAALAACGIFTDAGPGGDQHDACEHGAFMENAFSGVAMGSSWARADDPSYPCGEFPGAVGAGCWFHVGEILTRAGIALPDVPAYCAKADPEGRSACLEGWSRDLGLAYPDDPPTIAALCPAADTVFGAGGCLMRAAHEQALLWADVTRPAAICRAIVGSSTDCFVFVGEAIAVAGLPERCERLAGDERDACRRGATR